MKVFRGYFFLSLWHSLISVFIPILVLGQTATSDGTVDGIWVIGAYAFMNVIILANAVVLLRMTKMQVSAPRLFLSTAKTFYLSAFE